MIIISGIARYKIKFILHGIGEAEGELIRINAPRTVEKIIECLPVNEIAKIYKNAEVYIDLPIKMGQEKSTKEVEKGDIAFWPMGSALCIFFEKIEPYSPVNIVGRITKGLELFSKVTLGTNISIQKIE